MKKRIKNKHELGKLLKTIYICMLFSLKQQVVLFWHFHKKCLGVVSQWKASLIWDAFFILGYYMLLLKYFQVKLNNQPILKDKL
jgi:hypothetical protein